MFYEGFMNGRDEVGIDDVDDAARVQSGARAVRVFRHGEKHKLRAAPGRMIVSQQHARALRGAGLGNKGSGGHDAI